MSLASYKYAYTKHKEILQSLQEFKDSPVSTNGLIPRNWERITVIDESAKVLVKAHMIEEGEQPKEICVSSSDFSTPESLTNFVEILKTAKTTRDVAASHWSKFTPNEKQQLSDQSIGLHSLRG